MRACGVRNRGKNRVGVQIAARLTKGIGAAFLFNLRAICSRVITQGAQSTRQADERRTTEMQNPRPTDAELELLTVLWSRGPSTVRAVHEAILERRPAQYTTVLKQLQIMDEKGLVKRDESERAHVYAAAQPRAVG